MPLYAAVSEFNMALAHNPRIVTDGLVLCLDAANSKSYPGSGTTWSDLTKNNLNASLINAVDYETNYGGEMTFDATNDYAVVSYNSSNFVNSSYTWSVFVKGQHVPNSTHNMPDIGYGSGSWPRMGFRELKGSGWQWISYSSAGSTSAFGLTIIPNTTPANWVHLCVTIDYDNTLSKAYYNAVVSDTKSIYPDVSGNSSSLGIGRAGNTATAWNEQFNGSIAAFSVYNRALTANEVAQNFAALRGRYGI